MIEFLNNNKDLIIKIVFLNAFIILWCYTIVLFITNKERLKKKGFDDEYVTLMKSTHNESMRKFILIFLLTQLVSSLLFYTITGEFTTKQFSQYIFIISTVVGMTYMFNCISSCNMKFKELAVKTNSDIIIDFNFKILKRMFNMPLEIAATLGFIYFAAVHYDHLPAIYLLAVIPWFNYLFMKKSKNLNFSAFKFNYLYVAKSNIMLHVLIGVVLFKRSYTFEDILPWYSLTIYFLLMAVFTFKLGLYLYQYPKLREEVSLFASNDEELTVSKTI